MAFLKETLGHNVKLRNFASAQIVIGWEIFKKA